MVAVAKGFVDESTLTKAQLDTLVLSLMVKTGGITLDQALKGRDGKVVSKGAYYRILSQAKKNVESAVFTMVISLQMGVLRPSDLEKLFAVSSQLPADVNETQLTEIKSVVDALVRKMVML